MKIISNFAMILSAGFGRRMLPLTKKIPKPLIQINGQPNIFYIINKLKLVGVENIVINTHYLSNKIFNALKDFDSKIKIIYEKKILDTGGGVKNAIQIGAIPKNDIFFVINSDIFWSEKKSIFIDLSDNWNKKKMDVLLTLKIKEELVGYNGAGDFCFKKGYNGQLTKNCRNKELVFSGIQIINPQILNHYNMESFSLSEVFQSILKTKRLYGFISDNEWYHVGTPDVLEKLNERLKE